MTSPSSPSIDAPSRPTWLRGCAWGAGLLWCGLVWRAWGTPLALLAAVAACASVTLTLCLARARTRLATQLAHERAARTAQTAREALLRAALAADIDQILAHSAALLGAERAWLTITADGGAQDHQWPVAERASTPETSANASPWWQTALGEGEVFIAADQSSGDPATPSRCAITLRQDEIPLGVLAFEAATVARPWGDADRELLHTLAAIFAQVLRRQRLERALATCREQDTRERRLIVADLNHKLRTPMTAVLGFAQLLAFDQSLADEHREFVREIESAGQALLAMLNDLVGIARG